MGRRFVVAASDLTPAAERRFIKYITSKGGTWWHWIPNAWLLSFGNDADIDVSEIMDCIIEQNPKAKAFVTEVNDIDWIAANIPGPPGPGVSSDRNWLFDFWGGEK